MVADVAVYLCGGSGDEQRLCWIEALCCSHAFGFFVVFYGFLFSRKISSSLLALHDYIREGRERVREREREIPEGDSNQA